MENLSIDDISYNKYVTEIANSNSNALILNGDVGHARILIRQLLLRGNETVRIFSGYLKDVIYSDKEIVEYLKKFLEKPGTTLKVLLQSPEENLEFKNKNFYTVCKDSGSCEIRFIPENSEHRKIRAHFVTMDDKSYRFCADIDKLKGVASFNRPGTVKSLNNLFDELFEKSSKFDSS